MLRYIKLKNYKSFDNLEIDFTRRDGSPKKTIFIYGENGAGKSNIISAILFVVKSLCTMTNQDNEEKFKKELAEQHKDSEQIPASLLMQLFKGAFFGLNNMIKESWRIGNSDEMVIDIGFSIDGKIGFYIVKMNEQGIVEETLQYKINKRMGTIFSIKNQKINLSPTIFADEEYKKEIKNLIAKYWGKNTLLAIIERERTLKNTKFISSNLGQQLLEILDYIHGFFIKAKYPNGEQSYMASEMVGLPNLCHGQVANSPNIMETFKLYETLLNLYLPALYSDIKQVEYNINSKGNSITYELCTYKLNCTQLIKVPFSAESTGTCKLVEIFPSILNCIDGRVSAIDEIDSGVHDLLMKEILENLEQDVSGQLIVTTHNTLLMETLRPEDIYILSSDVHGVIKAPCISDYKDRTQVNNNMRKKYLRGDYSGIPSVGALDFAGIGEELKSLMKSKGEKGVDVNA